MRRRRRRVVGATIVGASALALFAGASAAVAQPAAPAGAAEALSELTLTMTPGDLSPGGTVTLECQPTGGTHPTPQAACDSLTGAWGYFELLPRADGWVCLDVVDPVTVTATGSWRGRAVQYEETFTNACEAEVGTDFVFRFVRG